MGVATKIDSFDLHTIFDIVTCFFFTTFHDEMNKLLYVKSLSYLDWGETPILIDFCNQ